MRKHIWVGFLVVLTVCCLGSYALAASDQWEKVVPDGYNYNLTPHDIWMDSLGTAYIAEGSRIFEYPPERPNALPRLHWQPSGVEAIWGRDSQNIFAVGDDGHITKYNGVYWQDIFNPKTAGNWNWYDVSGNASNNVVAGGGSWSSHSGSVSLFDGTFWITMDGTDSMGLIEHLWMTDTGEVYAIPEERSGIPNYVYYYDHASWTPLNLPNQAQNPDDFHWRGLFGLSADSVYAWGDGHLVHYNGTTWTSVPSNYEPVWGTAEDNLYGYSGSRVFHWDGTFYSPVLELIV